MSVAIGFVILALALIQFAHGTVSTLIPLALEQDGQASATIGIVISAFPAGYLAGSTLAVPLIRRFGHAKAFVGAPLFLGLICAMFPLVDDVPVWIALRAAMGVLVGVLFTLLEG